MTDRERQIRQNVRNFLLVATMAELKAELRISQDKGDTLRARFVQELIEEAEPEELGKMTTDELVRYFNIMTMGGVMIKAGDDQTKRHLPIVKGLLQQRGVAVEDGKLLTPAIGV